MIRKMILQIIAIILFATSCHSATYYIDYINGSDVRTGIQAQNIATPWATAPGMATKGGVARGLYTHSPGDTFVFKGGVIWPDIALPLSITASGSEGGIDSYTSDPAWGTGLPIFDGGSANPCRAKYAINTNGNRYIKISRIRIQNMGQPGLMCQSEYPIYASGSDNIEISYNEISPYCNHGIVLHQNSPCNGKSNIYIHHNKISNTANFIEMGSNCSAGVESSNIQIYNNELFNPGPMMVGGDHVDGIHIFNTTGWSSWNNIKIFNNKWYGDWRSRDTLTTCTAMIFLEGSFDTVEIYNNSMSFDNTTTGRSAYLLSNGFIQLAGCSNVKVYNNTIVGDAIPGAANQGAVWGIGGSGTNVDIRNNIISKVRFPIYIAAGYANWTIDNNIYNPSIEGVAAYGPPPNSQRSWSQHRSDGFQTSGYFEDPQFVSNIPGAYNLRLKTNSRGKSYGANLSSIFMTDIIGAVRPYEGVWDIGAYKYGQTTLSSPSNFRQQQQP